MHIGFRHAILGVLLTATLGIATSGCFNTSDIHDCNDGLDNDGDELRDIEDPGCAANGTRENPDPTACNDGVDNDEDGLTDLEDPGCLTDDDDDESHIPRPVCSDGIDNDEDGLIDYPNDPGCFLPLEEAEEDECPSGELCPACANEIDDDGDGMIDYSGGDPGCEAASDFDEFHIDEDACGGLTIRAIPDTGAAMGNVVVGAESELESPVCSGEGSETAFVMQITEPGILGITTVDPITTADTVVYIRSDCLDSKTELACNDNVSQASFASDMLVEIDTPGAYYIIVDSANLATFGGYRLEVTQYPFTGTQCTPGMTQCAPGQTCRPLDENTTETACWPPVCSDEHDNDSDGSMDFPNEPGCQSPEDTTEDDDCPDGPNCPACSNGQDDDSDGLIDFPADSIGCISASDTDESDCPGETDMVGEITGPTTNGSTLGFVNDFMPSCSTFSTSPDAALSLRFPGRLNNLTIDTNGSSYNTILYVKTPSCADPDIACDDNGGAGLQSLVSLTDVPAGNYFVLVDGSGTVSGNYTVNVTGEIAAGEPCDIAQVNAGMFQCEDGFACDGTSCVVSLCANMLDDDGDGLVDFPDDPGCSSTNDADEFDDCPSGTSCAQCSNLLDDDGDTLIDYPVDPGCGAAGDDDELDECIPGVPTIPLDPTTGASGMTSFTAISNFRGTCNTSTTSPEDVYFFGLNQTLSSMTFSTEGSLGDTVLYARFGVCSDMLAEVGCANVQNGGESITVLNPMQGPYYVFVDGDFLTGVQYVLNVSGTIPLSETCDPLDQQFVCEDGLYCESATNTCEVAQCDDLVDNDADTIIDFPTEPGCESRSDNNETDTCPLAGCPQCSDTIDNDSDMVIDFPDDVGCTSAGDDDETTCPEDSDGVVLINAASMTGTTATATHDFTPSCNSSSTARDVVLAIRFPGALDTLNFNTNGSGYDTMLMVKVDGCDGGDIGCDDDGGTGLQSSITLSNISAGTYFAIVDGFGANSGSYFLNTSGVVSMGELCDPAHISANIVSCAGGTSCTDMGTGFRCQ